MDELEQKLQNLRHIALNNKEREGLRSTLLEYTKHRPVRSAAPTRHEEHRSISLLYTFEFLLRKPMPVFIIAALLVFTTGGSVSLAAEGAVPGDPLYPVKVGVNEQVLGALAISDKSEAELQAQLVERRLEEAEQLAAEGTLTNATRVELETRLTSHVEKYEERVESVEKEDDGEEHAEIEARFQATLEAHENVLAQLEREDRIEVRVRDEVGTLAVRIRQRIDERWGDGRLTLRTREEADAPIAEMALLEATTAATDTSMVADEEVATTAATSVTAAPVPFGTETAARARIQIAKRLLESAESRFKRLQDAMSSDAKARLENKIEEAGALLEESKMQLEEGRFGESLVASRNVMRLATEIRVEANLAATFHSRNRDDDSRDNSREQQTDEDSSSHDRGLTEAEATVFTNETIVEIELNDQKHFFVTDGTERNVIIDEIVGRFELTREEVEAVFVLEVEDRASRPDDIHDDASEDDSSSDELEGRSDDDSDDSDSNHGNSDHSGRDDDDGSDDQSGRGSSDEHDDDDDLDEHLDIDSEGRVKVRF